MAVHIGKTIQRVVKERGMTASEFGRRIKKSRENSYSIFRRQSIDTALLEVISAVLEYDFFQYYTPLKNEVQRLREENELLKDMNTMLKKAQKGKVN